MPTPVTYALADCDGVLCVTVTQTEYGQPMLCTDYWPTLARTRDFCRYHECQPEELATRFEVRRVIAGFYDVTDRTHGAWRTHYDLALVDGGKTQSIRRELSPYPPPKTRCKTEYRDGRWHKYSKTKGWQAV
jgi:hypothetical protein